VFSFFFFFLKKTKNKIKNLQILGTPQFHPKSKPFYDHLFSFSVADDKVWFRCYQITETTNDAGVKEPALVEIGPRFVLTVCLFYFFSRFFYLRVFV